MRGIIPAIGLVLLAPLALAQTTRTYSYDALGRLTKVTPGTGTPVCYAYDAADNRASVSAVAGCVAGASPPPPPPPPPPPNSPPTAVNAAMMMSRIATCGDTSRVTAMWQLQEAAANLRNCCTDDAAPADWFNRRTASN